MVILLIICLSAMIFFFYSIVCALGKISDDVAVIAEACTSISTAITRATPVVKVSVVAGSVASVVSIIQLLADLAK